MDNIEYSKNKCLVLGHFEYIGESDDFDHLGYLYVLDQVTNKLYKLEYRTEYSESHCGNGCDSNYSVDYTLVDCVPESDSSYKKANGEYVFELKSFFDKNDIVQLVDGGCCYYPSNYVLMDMSFFN